MTVGDGVPFLGYDSAIGVAKQVTTTTFVTSTAFLEFNTESLVMTREEKKLEGINTTRDYTKRFQGNEAVDGTVDFDMNIASDACMMIVKQAMGGTVASLSLTVDMYKHTFFAGDMDNNKATSTADNQVGLSFAVRKGDTHVWNYELMRVNNLSIAAEIGEVVKVAAEMMGKTASVSATIPTVVLTDELPLVFTGVTVQTGDSITNLGAECFKSVELSLSNNIDGDQRCLGSAQRSKLPALRREVMLSLGQRFDTLTAWNRFIENTMTAIQVNFESAQTIGAAVGNTVYSMYVKLPECYLNSNTPQVGGVEVIEQDLSFSCIRNATTGSSIQMVAYNGTANYE